MKRLEILLGENFLPEKFMVGIFVFFFLVVGVTGFFFFKGTNGIELSILKEKILHGRQ